MSAVSSSRSVVTGGTFQTRSADWNSGDMDDMCFAASRLVILPAFHRASCRMSKSSALLPQLRLGLLRGIHRSRTVRGLQRFQKAYQRVHFRRAEVLSIGRHIAAALQHLTNQLVFGESRCYVIERRTALSAQSTH